MHDQTQGILALVVRLFQLSQLQAIRTGGERLTEELITEVAADKFKLVAPMLTALRNKDEEAILIYEDLLIKGLHEIKTDVGMETKIALLEEQAEKRNQNQNAYARSNAVSALVNLDFEESNAQGVVTDFFNANPNSTSSAAVRAILQKLAVQEGTKDIQKGRDFNALVEAATASGQSPEEALISAGLIESPIGKN